MDGEEKRRGGGRRWRPGVLLLWCCLIGALLGGPGAAAAAQELAEERGNGYASWNDGPWAEDPWSDDPWNGKTLADPLEPLNRFFYTVNDRLYFWALKPVATGYAKVPQDIRLCVRSFFRNLMAPVRVVNHLLQGQFKDGGTELARLAINTTIGLGGLVDSAARNFGIQSREADLGQTLGIYGFGEGFYIHWPLLGPSTLRDTVGLAGDSFFNPLAYLMAADARAGAGAYAGRTVNNTSLSLGEYERLVESTIDPYLAVRDAYWQYRRNQIRNRDQRRSAPALFGGAEAGPHYNPAGYSSDLPERSGGDDLHSLQVRADREALPAPGSCCDERFGNH